MADAITTTADPVQLARLAKALDELQRYTGRDCFQSVMYAAVKIGRSGAAACKPKAQLRERIRNPMQAELQKGRGPLYDIPQEERYKLFSKYIIIARCQPPKADFFHYTNNPNDEFRKIPRRGLSRNIWSTLSGMAASTRDQQSGTKRGAGDERWAQFRSFNNENVSEAKLDNLLTYMQDAWPGVQSTIITNGVNALNYQINKALGITIDRANRP
jgi:hypothetical protein